MNDQSLRELLPRYPVEYQPLSAPRSIGGGGGLSGSRLWRFHAPIGELVVRAWPPHGPGRKHWEEIHAWLAFTAELGYVPVPLRDRRGTTLQETRGACWELTAWMPGICDSACPPDAERLKRAFAALAAFHQRLAHLQTIGVSAGIRQRADEIGVLVNGGINTLETAIEHLPQSSHSVERAACQCLELARKFAPPVLATIRHAAHRIAAMQPTIRDTRPEHFLFEGNDLTGLVDFGAMGVDSVACDLARLIGTWLDGDLQARQSALESYERVRPLDPVTFDLIRVFEASNAILMGTRWIRWHFVERRTFDDPDAVARGLGRGLRLLVRHITTQGGPAS